MKHKKLFLQHIPLLYFIWASVFMTLGTRWVAAMITIPLFPQIVAILSYLPFAIACLFKFLYDLKALKQGKPSLYVLLYYGFAVYYLCITAFRFFGHMQWKDSLYFFIILYGALSLLELIQTGHIPVTKKSLSFDIWAFVGFLLIYRIVFVSMFPQAKNTMPINLNIYASVLVFALYTTASRTECLSKACQIAIGILSFGAIVGIMLIGARALFALMLMALVLMLLMPLLFQKSFRAVLKRAVPILCAFLIVAALFLADYSNTRYAVYRETNLSFLQPSQSTGSAGSTDDVQTPVDTQNPTELPEQQIIANNQISRSDNMRSVLLGNGIREIKKNFFFGTGSVLFEFQTSSYLVKNPAHNLVVETMNCFGFIGLVWLSVLILLLLCRMGLFRLKEKTHRQNRLTALCLVLSFGALGMVQAIFYDKIVLPFILVCIGTLLLNTNQDSKDIPLRGNNHG